jgi:prepilin-type N-terminal cleavage/methylation domain-containing protein
MARGFTLIELMIVVAISGVASAPAGFNMADQVKDARATAYVHTVVEELRGCDDTQLGGLVVGTDVFNRS